MKNAFVLVDHLGDNGTVTEGMILKDVTTKRFDSLEKKGLVREATAAEVKEGYKPPFEASGVPTASESGEKQAAEPQNKKAPEPANKAGGK